MKYYILAFAALAIIAAGATYLILNNKKDAVVLGTNENAPQAETGQKSDETIYVDVRTEQEWNEGHVNGALFFELARLEKGEMPQLNKNQEINLYCRSGRRAEEAKTILLNNGFINVKNLGGIEDLKSSGIKMYRNQCLLLTKSPAKLGLF